MRFAADYDRSAAVQYAHQWAYGRNPAFYDYEHLGGDCTNFASQCLFAGSGVMNFTPTFGWYYIDSNQKAPAWTGVPYFYNFLTRQGTSVGPMGRPCTLEELLPGDVIQLSFRERSSSTRRWWWLWATLSPRRTSCWRLTALTPITGLCPLMNIGISGRSTSSAPCCPEGRPEGAHCHFPGPRSVFAARPFLRSGILIF